MSTDNEQIKKSEWIAMEKELPPVGKWVLLSDKTNESKGDGNYVIGFYKGDECGNDPCYTVKYIDEITFFGYTYWQELYPPDLSE